LKLEVGGGGLARPVVTLATVKLAISVFELLAIFKINPAVRLSAQPLVIVPRPSPVLIRI
jgi:hypothetical protein